MGRRVCPEVKGARSQKRSRIGLAGPARTRLGRVGQPPTNGFHCVIPSVVEESLTLPSAKTRDVSASFDMTNRAITAACSPQRKTSLALRRADTRRSAALTTPAAAAEFLARTGPAKPEKLPATIANFFRLCERLAISSTLAQIFFREIERTQNFLLLSSEL